MKYIKDDYDLYWMQQIAMYIYKHQHYTLLTIHILYFA